MFGKFLFLGSVVVASLLVAGPAQAEGNCPDGYFPIGGGNAGWEGCAPYDTRSEYPTLPNPDPDPRPEIPTKYANSYISVAWHPNSGEVWASWNHWNDTNSNAAVVKACTLVMGLGCTIAQSGWNISIAIARDEINQLWNSWGYNPKQARQNVLKGCEEKKKKCKVMNVFTAEPLIQPANFTPIQQEIIETNPAFNFSKNYFPDRAAVSKAPKPPFAKYETPVMGHKVEANQNLANILIATSPQEQKESIEKQFVNDPRYALIKAGYWELMPRAKGLATGDGCAATFATLSGAVSVAGSNGEYRNAAITFFGGNIPIPKNSQLKKVTLAQTGGKPPATVEAYHFPLVDGKLGAITFVVPNASALVNNMFDEHHFAVSLSEKEVIDITWRGGHSIRDRLTKCLNGSGNPY